MFPFYMILAEFCEKLEVVSSDFSIMTNVFASSSSRLLIKVICCIKSGFSSSICLLKSFAINL